MSVSFLLLTFYTSEKWLEISYLLSDWNLVPKSYNTPVFFRGLTLKQPNRLQVPGDTGFKVK